MTRSILWRTQATLSLLAIALGCTAEPQVESAPELGVQSAEEAPPVAEPGAPTESGASLDPSAQPTVADTAPIEPEPEPIEPERWAALKQEIRDKFPKARQLSAKDLGVWLASDKPAPMLLDVRESAEFNVSHLEQAQRAIDLNSALAALGDAPLDQEVVLYCSVGYRSSALAEQLMARGYTNLFNLEGSIFEWANRGEAVYADGTQIELVHPYDTHWGELLRRDYWSDLGDASAKEAK